MIKTKARVPWLVNLSNITNLTLIKKLVLTPILSYFCSGEFETCYSNRCNQNFKGSALWTWLMLKSQVLNLILFKYYLQILLFSLESLGSIWTAGYKRGNRWLWDGGLNPSLPVSIGFWAKNEPSNNGQAITLHSTLSYYFDDEDEHVPHPFFCERISK